MSSSDEVREALIDMGVDPAKSHAASTMFGSVDAAINWVFGEGENWQPPAHAPPPPDYVTAPQPPPSPANDRPAFGSNNPFAQQMGQSPAIPPPPPRRPDDDTRHVRASAPPPSPGVEQPDPLDGVPFFGPTNKDDPDNKLAVASPNAASNSNKEEEDFQRAIQESMMTASFHSTGSAAAEELPPAGEREDGQPLVYVTLKHPPSTVQMIQASAAIPQSRQVLAAIDWKTDDPSGESRKTEGHELEIIQESFKSQDTEKVTYEVIDPALDSFQPNYTNPNTSTVYANITGEWSPGLLKVSGQVGRNREQLIDFKSDVVSDWQHGPDQLVATSLHINPDEPHPYVMFERGFNQPTNSHAALSSLIWGTSPGGGGGEGVEALGDVQFVHLHRSPGFPAPQWELDETIVLDRYSHHNRSWVTRVRAEQNFAEAELARLREKVESSSNYKGSNISDAIQTLVKHMANSPSSDPVQKESRAESKAKLEKIAEKLNEKTTRLQEEIKEKEKQTSGALFETDDPEKTQHRYLLRAVMWHDGFSTPGKHLYSYIKEGDQWWKVEAVEATKVTWEEISSDSTGQFTDGGPYSLIYSRDGSRPAAPPRSPEATRNVGVWGGMEGPGVHPADWSSSNLIDIDEDSECRQTPSEPEHETLKDDLLAPGTTITAVPVRSRRNTMDSEASSRETTREERREGDKRPSTISYAPPSPVAPSRQATHDSAVLSPPSRKSSLSGGVSSPSARKATLSPSASRKSTLESTRSPSRRASGREGTPGRKMSASGDTNAGVLSPSRKNTHDSIRSQSRRRTTDTDTTARDKKREPDGDSIMD